MNSAVLLGGITILMAWGIWGVAAKIATQHLGLQALLWGQAATIGFFPLYFLFFKDMLPLKISAVGISWAVLGGVLGAIGTLVLYLLLRNAPSSLVIPLSALYPVVTVLLASFFLHEDLSINRVLGIGCALAAIWLLSS